MLPTFIFNICIAMSIDEKYSIKQSILNYARTYGRIEVPQLVSVLGIKTNTARQYLCTLTKENKIARTGNGEYMLTDKQVFSFAPTETLRKLYVGLKEKLPFTDFWLLRWQHLHHTTTSRLCESCLFMSRPTGMLRDSVFSLLKDSDMPVYKQPTAKFMYDYVNMHEPCIIVKIFVTESPVNKVDGMVTPTIEKLLVDIQKDEDFDYMQGTEITYMYQTAFDLYTVNTPKMLRYAKRRGAYR